MKPHRAVPAPPVPNTASSRATARAPGRHDRLPAVDERLIAPEAHAQVLDGVVYETMGANEGHAAPHATISHVFTGCLAPGFSAAVDMLTRVDRKSDVAPDVSVYPSGPDARTGGRQLEQIAVEVVDTESVEHVTQKAARLSKRGVRRLFFLRVLDGTVHEWEHAAAQWRQLAADAEIVDVCFCVPVPVRAFAERLLVDDVIARALIARGNPVIITRIQRSHDESWQEGRQEGERGALVSMIEAKLRRPLSDIERNTVTQRVGAIGRDRLIQVVLERDDLALATWIADGP